VADVKIREDLDSARNLSRGPPNAPDRGPQQNRGCSFPCRPRPRPDRDASQSACSSRRPYGRGNTQVGRCNE
jgi:hypothetical protein